MGLGSASVSGAIRLPRPAAIPAAEPGSLLLGFDIGSTGSKVVALDLERRQTVWESYQRTSGNPVGAAQSLMRAFTDSALAAHPVVAVAATGSGREIVGSLLGSCYGSERVYVLNEIAAHAEGALHFDPRVDTIFEIGGQDAKYIRLADGRVVDAAMNEACSAGTGSFIEEQGRKLAGIRDVVHLGEEALAADGGVSLGQHCSVFMAEIIDEAAAAGVPQRAIVTGIYDSIIQNYLNRVKGSRSVGQVIFCQGMPFAADALAAAVVRQTGSQVIVPPNPGTVGALGIALLAAKHLDTAAAPIDPRRFLDACVERRDTFVCEATQGCGEPGNRCRIDRLTTLLPPLSTDGDGDGKPSRRRFTWGGGCSLWDKGTRRRKLPDLAPDPFREREALIAAIIARTTVPRGAPRVALTDEFMLKGLAPFFLTFLHQLGLDPVVETGADHDALKRGIARANVPWCAPMQQYHGLVEAMVDGRPDSLLLPMLRELPRTGSESYAVVCPIVQATPDIVRHDLPRGTRVLSPVIDIGPGNLESASFRESCRSLAASLGIHGDVVDRAHRDGVRAQSAFDRQCLGLGQRALDFCMETCVVPVVVLGRSYTIYNQVLNSNVPAILREQGAIAIPVDCFPVGDDVPVFGDVFWGHGQRNLRAAHQIRRTPGLYSLYCSNYSCGPDSFVLHFYAYLMDGKPFATIETDGHSGDAGTKTRVEAFLHCVAEDRDRLATAPRALDRLAAEGTSLPEARQRGETVIMPRMGPGAETLSACLRGVGVRAECLPLPSRDTLVLGRRHTSGKECVPMTITAGSLLERLERAEPDERFAFFMPTAEGPCRFGVYNLLHKIILERLGFRDRVRVWSPSSSGYFDGIPGGFSALCFASLMAADLLLDALHDTRLEERHPGAALATYHRYKAELDCLLAAGAGRDLDVPQALLGVATGRLFGLTDLLRRAGRAFAALRLARPLPTVLVVGEIYVRLDPFANDFIVDKLEQRGIRAKLAPFNEWLEYTDYANLHEGEKSGFGARLSSFIQSRIQTLTTAAIGAPLGWPPRSTVPAAIEGAKDYLREDLVGEAVLTIGGPVHEWRAGHIDGVVSVGPHECMPNKIAESQLFQAARREGLLSLTLPLNGDPIDPEILDNFAFEVHARFARRRGQAAPVAPRPPEPRTPRLSLDGLIPIARLRQRPGAILPGAIPPRSPARP